MHIAFAFGQVVSFESLSDNTVALDGAVQGPHADPGRRRFSFDHHGGCLRLVTLATCQQVDVALELGLVVSRDTKVVINDLDADTVLAVWLLRGASQGLDARRQEPRVQDLIRRVGLTDSHGPVFPPHPMHAALGPAWGDKTPQSVGMLDSFLSRLDIWYETGIDPASPKPRDGAGFALRAGAPIWEPVTTPNGFAPLYAAGYLAAALCSPAADGTLMWVVGKRSDLVPLALGPADLSTDRSGDYAPTLLGELARREAALGVTSQQNWGGGSSIGGSPRLEGGRGSQLSQDDVLAVLNAHIIR